MAQSTQCFTQSLRFMDPVNQNRIKSRQRILWPDYETLALLNKFYEHAESSTVDVDLSNLFMYCTFDENFLITRTNTNIYLNLKQLYSDEFTHLAFWVCKGRNYDPKLLGESAQNSRAIQNKRQKSIQKGYRTTERVPSCQDMYVILCKRSLAIDQIVKSSHKVCISVAPLSSQKFLWGGALNYEEFESFQQQKKEQGGLFKTGGESFGFKIDAKRSFGLGSYRKSNGLIDKRQQRYSNYFKAQKWQQKSPLQKNEPTPRKQHSNRLSILPQHIRQHQQFLYIEIDLDNNSQLPQRPDEYRFVSLEIYARHLKPKYGGVYQCESSSQDSQDEYNELKGALNKYKRLLKQEIFIVYSMPLMEFNSYVESQLNFEESQQLRQINFRGSCVMFSAMRKLELKSNNSKEGNMKQGGSLERSKKQRFMEIEQEKKEQESIRKCFTKEEQSQKRVEKEKMMERQQSKEIIQIVADPLSPNNKQALPPNRKELLRLQRRKILAQLCKKFSINQENLNNEQQKQEIYIPVLNPEGFEPLRIGVERQLMQHLNPSIGKLVAKVFVEVGQIRRGRQQGQQTGDNSKDKRLSVYVGKKRGQPVKAEEQQDMIGIDVFLTDKVYKQQTVNLVIDLISHVKRISPMTIDNEDSHNNHQYLLKQVRQIQQLRNILTLLSDIQGESVKQPNTTTTTVCDDICVLVWVQMLQRLDEYSESRLKLIRQVQQQTRMLIARSDAIKLHYPQEDDNQRQESEKALEAQQQHVIDMIKAYHHAHTTSNCQPTILINLFFFFLNTQLTDNSTTVTKHFRTLNDQNKLIQNVLNDFFLTNCKSILDSHSLQLSTVINRLSQNRQHLNKQSTRLICTMLRQSVQFVIENLQKVPVDVFLSEPLEQFQGQHECEHHVDESPSQDLEFTERRAKPIFSYQRLKRFLKKYFIKGHNFLQRQASQNLIDADNSYMSLITDLLNLFIKLTNTQNTLINSDNNNNLLHKPKRPLSNVIQLIQDQYSRCVNTNNVSMVFGKVMREQDGIKMVEMNRVDRNQLDEAMVMRRSLQRKQVEIVGDQAGWRVNVMGFLVTHHHQPQQQQPRSLNNLTITNHRKPISLSHNNNNIQLPSHFLILNFSHKLIKTTLDLQSSISFVPAELDKLNNSLGNGSSSYSIDLVKSRLGLGYCNRGNRYCASGNNKSLFDCFEVFVEVQITTNKSALKNDVNNLMLKGSNVLMFERFNHSQINKNNILLHHFTDSKKTTSFPLSSICHVNVKIYSKKLPILQASLSFINFRLGKYLKNLLKKQNLQGTKSASKASKRKTVGGRFTEYLNNRKSVHAIEENIFFAQGQKKLKTSNQISTLFQLPETLLFDILRADKNYIQDEEKIMYFIDAFYERNQPQFTDYILYLCVRPNFLRSSSMLKHYFANKLKYDESKILSQLIKKRLSTCVSNDENQNISQLIIGKPRISSVKSLTNIRDTVEQRELLNKYMRDLTRKNSSHKNQQSHSLSKPSSVFSKQPIFQIKQQQQSSSKEGKDIQI